MSNEPFFIVGVGRSGTTLLRLMMHNHPRIAVPYESHFITSYIDKLPDYGNLDIATNLQKLVVDILSEPLLESWDHTFEESVVLARVARPASLASVIDAIYADYAEAKGKVRWGDKSDYLDRMHLINEVFPKAKFIHIVRDGRDVANSVMKMDWGPADILRAADWWHEHVKMGRIVGRVLGPSRYTEIRYEDLTANPERELARLCAFLGEEYSDSMLRYHELPRSTIPEARRGQHHNTDAPPTRTRSFAWKSEMPKRDQALFCQLAGETLNGLGYEVPEHAVSTRSLAMAKAAVLVKRQLSR